MPSIGINDFVRRQTAESDFTHFTGPLEEILPRVEAGFAESREGYRPGVLEVPIDPNGFFCGVVTLQEGDKLCGRYEARRPGEEPRKTLRVLREGRSVRVGRRMVQSPGSAKAPCVAVDVILYSRETLAENGENTTTCDWEIVSINGRITEERAPIDPDTLIANHFQLDGGTATGMSAVAFERALRESVLYWRNKAISTTAGTMNSGDKLREEVDRLREELARRDAEDAEQARLASEFAAEDAAEFQRREEALALSIIPAHLVDS